MTISFIETINLIKKEVALSGGIRLQSVIFLYRLSYYSFNGSTGFRHLFRPIAIIYRLYTEFMLGIELPARTKVGPGLRIYHGVGLVVHKGVNIGNNCILRQGVTIGNKGGDGQDHLLPKIGNNVEFGANAIVIGDITIGNNVVIGAGAVVTKSVPADSVVVGFKSQILKKNTKTV